MIPAAPGYYWQKPAGDTKWYPCEVLARPNGNRVCYFGLEPIFDEVPEGTKWLRMEVPSG